MNTTDNLTSEDFAERKVPGFLNVLTILTFIGSAIQVIAGIYQFITAPTSYKNKDAIAAQMNNPEMPKAMRKMMGSPDEFAQLMTKSYENRVPIVLVALVAATLCIIGAIQMRKLKKQGFIIYTIGEVLGIISPLIFIGTFIASGWSFIFGVAIAVLFIIMYAVNRKELKY